MITRESAKALLPIIKAYSEGKKIQYFKFGEWIDMEYPDFTDLPSFYRIKPKPKYRPFKNVEECWEEMQKHQPFSWVKYIYTPKNEDVYCSINRLDDDTNFNYCFDIYLFADGTPFGIKEEE